MAKTQTRTGPAEGKLPEPDYDASLPPFYVVETVRRQQREMNLPNFDQRCVQCRGEPDGKEYLLVPKGGGKPVLLLK
jgi:hypothetical protein